jgi:hypothetical protein
MRKNWRTICSVTAIASLCCVGGRAFGQADYQYPQYVQYPQGAPPVSPAGQITLAPDQLDQLLGQVALYPDPLLSLIFPASTYPQDVVGAEQWLVSSPNPTEADIAAKNWDASIKGLVHYPTVLKMMSDQIDWTTALGAAFLNQQKDVLASVQRLRAEAQAAQNLQTNQQEQILAADGSIFIEPVDPAMMYVPDYDATLVYDSESPISFGIGFPIGIWCDDDFDWGGGYVEFGGGWYHGWNHPSAWDQHPPAWDRGNTGWSSSPREWARNSSSPAPRLAPSAVSHLNLDRPRGAAVNRSAQPAARPAAPQPSKNAFEPANSRADVQRDVQRAQPAAANRQPVAVRPNPAPRPVAESPAPRNVQERAAPAEPRSESPEAPQAAAGNAFDGGSGGDARAQSDRGNASSGHRGK